MKKLFVALGLIFASGQLSYTQTWQLDTTFNETGIVSTQIGNYEDVGTSAALQSDGKVIVSGYTYNGMNFDFAIARYLSNGLIDSSYGVDGHVVLDFNFQNDFSFDMLLQADDKAIVIGVVNENDTTLRSNIGIVRFHTNGVIDSSYGDNGIVITDFDSTLDRGRAIVMEKDGNILIAGYSSYYGDSRGSDFLIVRYDSVGRVDSSFGTNGFVITSFDTVGDNAFAIAIQTDRKILVGGECYNPDGNVFALSRYHPTGVLDSTFGVNGKVLTDCGKWNSIRALAVQADEKIIAAGFTQYDNTHSAFGILRYNTDGSLDSSFAQNGMDSTNIGNWSACTSMILLDDGKILLTGSAMIGANHDFVLARYLNNGDLDTSFNGNGIFSTDLSTNDDISNAVLLQADGKILEVGFTNNGVKNNFGIVRLTNDLTLGIVDHEKIGYSLLVYPNPISDFANLKYTILKEQDIAIKLFDLEGRLIEIIMSNQLHPIGDYQIPMKLSNSLVAGNYMLELSSEHGSTAVLIVKK